MPQRRTPNPQETKDKLLVKCKHRCCICGGSWVQIHHIDGNPSNNDESNLIPLCRNHAGVVHISPPPSAGVQAITPSQLRLSRAKIRKIPRFQSNVKPNHYIEHRVRPQYRPKKQKLIQKIKQALSGQQELEDEDERLEQEDEETLGLLGEPDEEW